MEPIAVIGFAFKLPQDADDVDAFWEILEEGRNVGTEWPNDRINIASFYDPSSRNNNTIKSRGAHFLNHDPAAFDAPFFSITAKEAAAMDPQQRILLETSYRALENAGITISDVSKSETAVYEASMVDDYSKFLSKDADTMPQMTATGTAHSIMANRISWFFNLLGPSIHVDTACSSSMVAADLAVQALQNCTSSMAIVAGSNLILGPEGSVMLSRMNFLSPDSRCYSFDHRANGYARGEGSIVLIMKRVCDAIENGDIIRAVIRATGSNQDGHTPGLSMPSIDSQERLIRSVYQKVALGFDMTRYIEAHGTGTPVGDPIEMAAIGRVFRTSRSPEEPLYVGSVKANIGHLEGASGLAGILKAILILEKGTIPPNALFEKVNPNLDIEFYNIRIPQKCTAWPSPGIRRISVNSFGFGGTNSHAILEDSLHFMEANNLKGMHKTQRLPPLSRSLSIGSGITAKLTPAVNGFLPNGDSSLRAVAKEKIAVFTNGSTNEHVSDFNGKETTHTGHKLLVWSAADENSLQRMLNMYTSFYSSQVTRNEVMAEKLAFTLAERRNNFLWRAYSIVDANTVQTAVQLRPTKPIRSSNRRGLAFVFTGQGAQYLNMGVDLLHFPVFKRTLILINQVLSELGCSYDLFHELRSSENIDRPECSQPLCTALQVALVELLRSLNIVPDAVVGHSSGEIAAAYTVGALDLESTCKVSYYRGLLAGRLATSEGTEEAMMSVNLSEQDAPEYISRALASSTRKAGITVACINSPSNVTLSGNLKDINILESFLKEKRIFSQKLKTGIAYHSPSMNAISEDYIDLMGALEQDRKISYGTMIASSVTGSVVRPLALASPEYWVSNLVSPVRFSDALGSIIETKERIRLGAPRTRVISDLLEIGPHAALRRPCMDTLGHTDRKTEVRYTSALHRQKNAINTIFELAGDLFTFGYPVSVANLNRQLSPGKETNEFLVDLPQYPFNHSQSYWHESRASYSYRMREPVPRDVLGTRAQDWSPLEPKWRKIINADELSWVEDHKVNGSVLYPATGMLVMAIEAVRQTAQKSSPIAGYLIKNALLSNPIVLKPGFDGVDLAEIILTLRPLRKPYEKVSSWSEVSITKYHDSIWNECLRATIQVLYTETHSQVDGGMEQAIIEKTALNTYEDALRTCVTDVPSDSFYQYCNDRGLTYGESFRILKNIRWDGVETAIGQVDVGDKNTKYQGIVHPAVIDAACQIFWVSPSQGLKTTMPTEVPHRVFEAYLAATGWKHPDTSHIRIHTTSRYKEVGRGVEGSITMFADNGKMLCRIRKMEMDPIADDDLKEASEKKLLYSIDWKPCLPAMAPEELKFFLNIDSFRKNEAEMAVYCESLDHVLQRCIRTSLHQLSSHDVDSAQPHIREYIEWMRRQIPDFDSSRESVPLEEALATIETQKPSWRMFAEVARNLSSIICGEVDPLALILSNNMAELFYDDIFANICDTEAFRKLVDLIAHQQPDMKILEVGAGTGGFTTYILTSLHQHELQTGGSAFSEYLYTDVSHGFFDGARSKFQRFASRMMFKPLDLEQDIAKQGFIPASYDLVIAGSVIHATASIDATLRNLRKALKPGGLLLFFELTKENAFAMNFGFGSLPGWWRSCEEWRKHSQGVNEERWHHLLQDAGFSGNDVVFRDYSSEVCHNFHIISSTAVPPSKSFTENRRVFLALNDDAPTQTVIARHIQNHLTTMGDYSIRTVLWRDIAELKLQHDDIVVCLAEFGIPLFDHMNESIFYMLKNLVEHVRNLLWVTSTDMKQSNFSSFGMAQGFLRTIRSEAISKRLVTLSLEGLIEKPDTSARHVATVFNRTFELESAEVEYSVRENFLATGRLREEAEVNERMLSTLTPRQKHEAWGVGAPLLFNVRNRGTLDALEFIEDPLWEDKCPLGDHELEVETKAWGLNFRDIFIALGRLEENDFGFDAAGIVTRVGSKCSLQPDDRVAIAVIGCMRKMVKCPEIEVIKIPDGLRFEDAAAITAPGVTAYHSLVDTARLQKRERILIHSASGATGQVSLQIAQWIGAEIYATVGTDEKKQFLNQTYGIPLDHIFYSRNTSFAQGVMRVTKGKGVHVILNSLSGDGLRASWECIAPYGRFVEIGKVDIKSNTGLPMSCFAKNVTFSAVDLHHVSQSRKNITQKLLQDTFRLYEMGAIHCPKPVHVFSVSAIEDAFRFFQAGKNTGRIVIKLSTDDVVKKRIISHLSWRFSPDASYLIAGGLGGIGRAISRWMMRKGVKNLILPSRYGVESKAAVELVEELTQNGVKIYAPQCDASKEESLRKVLAECAKTMPPIKGCINAAMDLQDSIFEHMDYSKWKRTTDSKVLTSWNLHNLLPKKLDFFILLSSLSGIYGSVSQANYAAGNTYKDSLARYRTSNGQKAIAFSLGWMRTIGIIAENEEYQKLREMGADMAKIEAEELLSLFEIYCDPSQPVLEPQRSQLLVGVVTPSDVQARGMDIPDVMQRPLFAGFSQSDGVAVTCKADGLDSAKLFKQAITEDARKDIVIQALALKLGRALSMSPDDVDARKPLFEYGVDSLVAVELRNWIGKEFSADIAVFDIMGGSTIEVVGTLVAKRAVEAKK